MRISRFLWKKPSWAYIHVHVSCVMRSSNEESFYLYEFSDLQVIWWIVPDINFKDIVEGTIYEPIIIFMPLVGWRHQNKKHFICVNVECFCLFIKLMLTWISKFLWNQPSTNNYFDHYHDQFVDDFHRLHTWIWRLSWKQPLLSLRSCWYLLHDVVIKTRKFLFIWMLNTSIYMINGAWVSRLLWK